LPEIRKAYLENGFVAGRGTPEALRTDWVREASEWQAIVRDSGVVLDN
jgi:hypothetical protein